jgi:glyoxylase I family protein
MDILFKPHHWALSVRDIDESAAFYSIFGFKLVLRWVAQDRSLTIAHLSRNDNFILELFEYQSNKGIDPNRPAVGNDLECLGVKHIAFKVASLPDVAAEFEEMQCGEMTEIQHGRTGIDYFFVADPDGNWVEIVQDDRILSPDHSVFLGAELLAL